MTTCSSSVSVQRSSKTEDNRSKSCDTVCTSNSSCFFQRRKPVNPLMYPVRPTYAKGAGNAVRQRVMSAKLLKLRSMQSQLNDANFHLSELSKENQTLKNMQKRQDKALTKYEGMNEDLPRLIRSHEEQLRILTEKNKTLRRNVRELGDLLKTREEELVRAHDKLNHLEKLNRDKHLTDREKLTEQLDDLKLRFEKSDEQVAFLHRKLMVESKTSKQRLNNETAKHKQCQKALSQALLEIDRLTGLLETKENTVHPRTSRFSRIGQRKSVSLVTLDNFSTNGMNNIKKLATIDDVEVSGDKTPITDIKLEPIPRKVEETQKKLNGILVCPSENIKNRLSSGSAKGRDSADSLNHIKEHHSSGSDISLDMREDSGDSSDTKQKKRLTCRFDLSSDSSEDIKSEKSRPTSGTSDTKLDKVVNQLDDAIQRATENSTEEFDKKLGEYCSDIMGNVRTCSERLEAQRESLRISKEDTSTILDTLKKTEKVERKLRNSLLSYKDADMNFITEMLSEETTFQTNYKGLDKNGNLTKKAAKVTMEDKKKLLATLKAIDNGDSVESVDSGPVHREAALLELLDDASK